MLHVRSGAFRLRELVRASVQPERPAPRHRRDVALVGPLPSRRCSASAWQPPRPEQGGCAQRPPRATSRASRVVGHPCRQARAQDAHGPHQDRWSYVQVSSAAPLRAGHRPDAPACGPVARRRPCPARRNCEVHPSRVPAEPLGSRTSWSRAQRHSDPRPCVDACLDGPPAVPCRRARLRERYSADAPAPAGRLRRHPPQRPRLVARGLRLPGRRLTPSCPRGVHGLLLDPQVNPRAGSVLGEPPPAPARIRRNGIRSCRALLPGPVPACAQIRRCLRRGP